MGPSTDDPVKSTVAGPALLAKYGTAADKVSAYENLASRPAAGSWHNRTLPAHPDLRPSYGNTCIGRACR